MKAVPGVVAFGETSSTPGFELVRRTVVPPWFDAPRISPCDRWSPLPTRGWLKRSSVIAGAVTVTTCEALAAETSPGLVAATVVVPLVTGSKFTPPAAVVAGVFDWPGRSRTTTLPPLAVAVFTRPTLGALL